MTTESIVQRPWGSYETVKMETNFLIKVIRVRPKQRLSLQSHAHRSESWTIVCGEATVTLADETLLLSEKMNVFIPRGAKHRIHNPSATSELVFVEVQLGDDLSEDDIVRFQDDYGRASNDERTHSNSSPSLSLSS